MGDRALMDPCGEPCSPSSVVAEDDASRAHHTELGVWLQLISMVINTSAERERVLIQKEGGAAAIGQICDS